MDKQQSLSRRKLLQKVTMAPVVIGAFTALQTEAEAKAPQLAVLYRSKPHGNKSCDECKFYISNTNIAHPMVAASESRVRSAPTAIAFFGMPAIIQKTGNDRSPFCVWHSSKFLNVRFVLKTTKLQTAEEIAEQRLERKREIARLMGAAELAGLRKPKPPAAWRSRSGAKPPSAL